LRDTPDTNLADLHSLVKRCDDDLPPLWIALAPILLPVGLITLDTAMTSFVNSASIENAQMIPAVWIDLIHAFGNKNTAITLSAVVSMIVLSRYQSPSKEQLASGIQGALASGGLIILITSAGGAFGETIRHCGITERIELLTTDVSSFWLLPLAFGVTTVMRTAQGSATVAMMTSSSILQYLAHGDQLGFHPVYIAAAIGCGSKPIAWMNDSGFWVICKMSGMTETEGLRTITPMSIIMGFTGLGATMIFARFFPLLEL